MVRREVVLASVLMLLSMVGLIMTFLSPRVVEAAAKTFFTVSQLGNKCYAYFANGTLFSSSTDSSVVVAAINTYLSNGGQVHFQNGSYVASNHWQITHPNIAFVADSGVSVDFRYPVPDNQDEGSSGICISAKNVTVQGFTIKNCSKSGIKVRDVANIILRNNTCWNTWTGISLESVNDSVISSNIVNLTQGDGIYVTGNYLTNRNSKNITVQNNHVYSVGDTGIDISNGDSNIAFYSITVASNNVKGFNKASASPKPIGLGVTISNNVSNFVVTANTIDSMNYSLFANGKNGVTSSNTLTNFKLGSGIWGTTSDNVTVSYNNIFSSSSSATNGIYTDKAWIISNNKITVRSLFGNSAINALNAIKRNNTSYAFTTLVDLVNLAIAYGSTPTSLNWNPAFDLNHDGVINLADLVILVANYKRTR